MTKIEYGINLNPQHSVGQPKQLEALQGLKWVRIVFQIAAAQYQNPAQAFDFYDPWIAGYRRVGARPLLILNQETFWGHGPWDHGDWPRYAREFASVAGEIAAHYKGQDVAYEIWNEGDIRGESSVYVAPGDFAPVLDRAAAAIKFQDPEAEIVFGGLASGTDSAIRYVQGVSQTLGGRLPVDAIGVHPYGHWPPPGRPDLPTGWFAPLDDALERYADAFADLPVWITEIGISEPGAIKPHHWPEVADYVDGVLDLVQRKYSQSIPVVIWFAWSDVMREAGLVDRNGQRKEPIYARFFEIVRREIEPPTELPPRTGLPLPGMPSPVNVLTPTEPGLSLRQGPGTEHDVLTYVNPGDRLEVLEGWRRAFVKLGRRGQWIRLCAPDGQEGWAAAWYLKLFPEGGDKTPAAGELTPAEPGLSVRRGPNTGHEVVTYVNPGDRLAVLEDWDAAFAKLGQVGKWIHIRTPDGQEGWSAAWFLKLAGEADEGEPPAEVTWLTPTGSELLVRTGPGVQFDIVASVNAGDRLQVLEDPAQAAAKLGQVGQWIRLRTPAGQTGWSAAWFLRAALDVEDRRPEPPVGPPTDEPEGQLRALSFDHQPRFDRTPVCDPAQVESFSGFGPNNFSYLTYVRGTDYYRNLGGLHNGLDFGMPDGTLLCSPDWGWVVHVSSRENDNPYGAGPFSIIVRYGLYVALFGHLLGLSQGGHLFVKEGDIVAPGTPIALSGTGNGFPHLHFEMRKIDLAYISRLRRAAQAATSDPEGQLRHMNQAFHLRGWLPTDDYYINPAQFFEPRLETYERTHGWVDACPLPEYDTEGNGYPDRVILAGQSQPMRYDRYTMRSYPAERDHFWRGSRQI